MEAVCDRVMTVIGDELELAKTEMTRESALVNDLGADSLDLFMIQRGIEGELDVQIPLDDWDQCRTIGDITAVVERVLSSVSVA